MMDTKIFELVEALLKKEGFTHLSKAHSAHSATISAEKGGHRLVMHMTDQAELSFDSRQNEGVPAASEIKLSARLPGLRPNATGQVLQRAGQGGPALSATERTKRHR
jgi:hypothetical protein